MGIELVLFIILAAVAIFSAALMLISRNAVHSALFLVVNFLCVSFFYLMLNAPFLSMIQVTVYAGAIMVLFMFVIMLLGSERLSEENSRYPWIAPAAVLITSLFLAVTFFVIVNGNITILQPAVSNASVRFVQVVPNTPKIDVYVDDKAVATALDFRTASDFQTVAPGDHDVLVFPSCTQTDATQCPDPIATNAAPIFASKATLKGDTNTTFVLTGLPSAMQMVAVPTDLTPMGDDNTFRVTAVNAMPGSQPVQLIQRDPAYPDPNDKKALTPLGDPLKFGDVLSTQVLSAGSYLLEWRNGATRIETLPEFTAKGKTEQILIFAPIVPANATTAIPQTLHLDPDRLNETFGSPQQIGQALLSSFILPFELVSLLLLAAMVGAIIMTREEVAARLRQRVVVSPGARRINAAIAANPRTAGADTVEIVQETSGD
jgi:NADH-quinone oxidoreductase subunit J